MAAGQTGLVDEEMRGGDARVTRGMPRVGLLALLQLPLRYLAVQTNPCPAQSTAPSRPTCPAMLTDTPTNPNTGDGARTGHTPHHHQQTSRALSVGDAFTTSAARQIC